MPTAKRAAPVEVEIAVLPFASKDAFATWMVQHHDTPQGIWMRFAKKGTGIPSITYAEALEVALAWGWIDGMAKGEDATWYRQKFTPRRARSLWSRINRERATAMIAAGTMQPPGLAEVERAKRDGRWDAAYDSPRTATVPPDLEAALASNRVAKAFFSTLDAQNRYAVLHRLQTAGSPEARQRRLAKLVETLAAQQYFHAPRVAPPSALGEKRTERKPATNEPAPEAPAARSPAKAAPAKAAPAKAAPAKAKPARAQASPAKAAAAKTSPPKAAPAKAAPGKKPQGAAGRG